MMINWKYLGLLINYSLLLLLTIGCQSDYTKMVKSELAKGVRYDSVLLGIKLGDTRNDFYGKCFDLNKAGLISAGSGGASIKYVFTDSVIHKTPTEIYLEFVPAFDQRDVITNVDIKFGYPGWAPWNKHLQSDSLKVNVIKLLRYWYGGNDFVIANTKGTKIPVKVDGNRRIFVEDKDMKSIVVRVQDLMHPKYYHSINTDTVGQRTK